MPFRSTSRIFAALFGALVCASVLASPAAFADGIDTPSTVTSLPFRINGARIMTMTSTGLGIGTANSGVPLTVTTGAAGNGLDGGEVAQFAQNGNTYITIRGTSAHTLLLGYEGQAEMGTFSNDALNLIVGNSSRMIINTSGNVGIGTTAPAVDGNSSLFVTVNNATAHALSEFSVGGNASTAGDYVGALEFYNSSLSAANKRVAAIFSGTPSGGATNSGDFEFYTWNAGNIVEPMVITPAGLVGIGITNPAAPLDVNGGIRGNSSGTVAGDACSPEGMLAYDMTNHQPVYCSSGGTWSASFMPGFTNRTYHLVNNAPGNNYYSNPWTNPYSYPAEAIMICQYNSGPASATTYISKGGSNIIQQLCSTNSGSASGCSATYTVPPGDTIQVYYGLCNAAGSLYILF
jgi:hypothetical protein